MIMSLLALPSKQCTLAAFYVTDLIHLHRNTILLSVYFTRNTYIHRHCCIGFRHCCIDNLMPNITYIIFRMYIRRRRRMVNSVRFIPSLRIIKNIKILSQTVYRYKVLRKYTVKSKFSGTSNFHRKI